MRMDRGRCTYVVSGEVVDLGLGQHAVVLELALPQGRSVAGNDDQLGLSGAEGLEGRLVAQSDPAMRVSLAVEWRMPNFTYFPDFITSARRELMVSVDFLDFLGAISAFVVVV
jgi:hypothetical protein